MSSILVWNNPISSQLWYVNTPTPGIIVFDGTYYVLRMQNVTGLTYQTTTLNDAQEQYVIQATKLLAAAISLNPEIPSLSLPSDDSWVAVSLSSGGYAAGTWSAANQQVTVTAQTIPVSQILAWSYLPS